MNITLIGMSGAGKSHVGKLIANQCSFPFYDVDVEMETLYQKSLQDILDSIGEEQFLAEQAAMLLRLTETEKRVISTGGSVVYTPDAMEHLSRISHVVFLDISKEIIESRIDVSSRGIVGLGAKTFAELYDERRPLYQKWADITISAQDSDEDILAQVKVLQN